MPPVAKSAAEALDGTFLTWPLTGEITGRFGEPRAGHYHEGIDIPKPVGTPFAAAADGKVVMREWQEGYGRYTCLAHAAILTCYAHQSRFHTKLGDTVHQGDVIGYTGDTGTSEAPHLHFEVRLGRKPWGKPVNPLKYLPRRP
jgi:peptidoglycan DL-endopeptidase CwlO